MTHTQKQIASDIAEVLDATNPYTPRALAIEYDDHGSSDETWFVGRTPDEAMVRAIEYFHDMRW